MKRASMLIAIAVALLTTSEAWAADALPTAKPESVGLSPERLKRVGEVLQREIDAKKFPDKYHTCRACEVQHRGMGTMEEDCKKAIPKPWR